ncbi:hypothetical protein ZEAMMB73_Zm00001d010763 [Zea mays]|uniref:Uncharacterized protein n=1 Tax=Zea mays TaxID=4577 RepID=A0A1D6FTH9_MAIZE|nr:hypothetical protein ZEAMMB73_Zm00001d010763 [Zea mays]
MGEGLGFLQSVVSSSAGYLRYYSNEEGYELGFCRSRGQAWTHCQAAFGESKKSESAMSKLMTRSLLLEPSLLKNTPR